MEREDWNYVALLTMANLFAGIVSSIYEYITGNHFNFLMFLVVYGIFYGIIGLLFSDTGIFDHEHFVLPLVIYIVLATIAGVAAFAVQDIIGKEVHTLIMYIILAILGMGTCLISKIIMN